MRTIMKLYLLLIIAILGVNCSFAEELNDRVPFADPFILFDKGMYYAYGTSSPNGICVAQSKDLKNWKMGVGRSREGLALYKDDSFGSKHFWAPEVYRVNGRYVMYYSAETHVCAAVAEHPCGPFRQIKQEPMMSDMHTIDSSLFFDQKGNPWMVFVKCGNEIWVTELEKDCLHVKPGTRHEILRATEPWEVRNPHCHVAEGPFVIYAKGVYILTYSANDYQDPDYAVGVATAKTPAGPWVKAKGNPILCRRDGRLGCGHHSLFKDKSGRWRIVYHAHLSTNPHRIHPRCMYVADLEIKGSTGAPELKVTGPTITCTVEKQKVSVKSAD